jgi:hypothetical protein
MCQGVGKEASVCYLLGSVLASIVLKPSMALAIAATLAACTSNSGSQLPEADIYVSPGQLFALRVGETAGVVASAAIDLVRFNGVANDSRCPQGVTCITEGYATVVLSVQSALTVSDVQMQVPPGGSAETTVEELTVEILELRPVAREGVTIDPLAYIAAMRVRETGSITAP